MDFFANGLNKNYLVNVLPKSNVEIDWVKAAIAYGDDSETLIKNCLENKRRLNMWMRYDHSVPVAPSLLKLLLGNVGNNIFCSLIPDRLHAKVIWWRNYGVYIGSANLTSRAWWNNIEFGVFISEDELESDGSLIEIESFFDDLAELDVVIPLTREIIDEQEAILELRKKDLESVEKQSRRRRSVEFWDGTDFINTDKNSKKNKEERFVREWQQGLSYLRKLADLAPNYKPSWLNNAVPASWQADQFLHAFYYNKVKEGNSYPYEEFYCKNSKNPAEAVERALSWWEQLARPPSDEDYNCHERAPIINELLAIGKIQELNFDEFVEICRANHSTADHVRRLSLEVLYPDGLDDSNNVDRIEAFATSIWAKRNMKGQSIKDLLHFVLDSGAAEKLPHRLYMAATDKAYKIPHFGINQLAEIAGWARPSLYPPRNGRTSKALRALGYDVKVY